jgi:hypothetical protein
MLKATPAVSEEQQRLSQLLDFIGALVKETSVSFADAKLRVKINSNLVLSPDVHVVCLVWASDVRGTLIKSGTIGDGPAQQEPGTHSHLEPIVCAGRGARQTGQTLHLALRQLLCVAAEDWFRINLTKSF